MVEEPDDPFEDTLAPEQEKIPTSQEKILTSSDRLVRIMQSITGDFSGEDLDEIIDLVEKIKSEKKGGR